jgi:hypothetical protein
MQTLIESSVGNVDMRSSDNLGRYQAKQYSFECNKVTACFSRFHKAIKNESAKIAILPRT